VVIRDYLARRVGPQSAEDLTGETFLVAFSKRDKYDVSQPNALPWLYGIASNLVRQRRRTEVRQLRALARTECWTKYEVTPSYPAGTPTDVVQPRPNPWGDELTFHPNRIPADMWLYIQAMVESRGNEEVPLRCDPNQQWEMSRNWVGDTTPGLPYLPPYQGAQPSPTGQSTPGAPWAPTGQDMPRLPTR
jgi:hypothetical protein